LLDSSRGKESRQGKGFVQPLTAHEHWHIDVADINIVGTCVCMAKLAEHKLTADGTKIFNASKSLTTTA
jgi:hypothetical protein